MSNRKLSRPSNQRMAILRNLTTALIWNDRIVTTEARAKEVRRMAEKLITLAVKEHKNTEEVIKTVTNKKTNIKEEKTFTNDMPSRLQARRKMISTMYNITDSRNDDESKYDYKKRIKEMPKYPAVEKLFSDIGPKYIDRPGGYTRIVKMGPRRGDAAEMVIIELV